MPQRTSAGIDDLPNELLLAIALRINRNSDLKRLSLVSRNMRYASQIALLNPAILPRHTSIGRLLDTMLSRPDLARQLLRVDLGDYGLDWGLDVPPHDHANLEFRKTLSKLAGQILRVEDYTQVRDAIESHTWGTYGEAYLAIMIAICPNLKELSIQMRPIVYPHDQMIFWSPFDLMVTCRFKPIFSTPLLQRMASSSVHTINIVESSLSRRLHTDCVQLKDFVFLKTLSIPFTVLIHHGKPTPISEALPKSLERLEIQACDNAALTRWLKTFVDVDFENDMPCFRHMVLYFRSNPRSIPLLMTQGNEGNFKSICQIIDAFMNLNGLRRLEVSAYTSNHSGKYSSFDFLAELQAFSYMCADEIAISSYKNEQYSFAIARDPHGRMRRRSSSEIQMFRRFYGMPTSLFTSPRYDFGIYAKMRLFNGNPIVQWNQKKLSLETQTPKVIKNAESRVSKWPRCDLDLEGLQPHDMKVHFNDRSYFKDLIWNSISFFPVLEPGHSCSTPEKMSTTNMHHRAPTSSSSSRSQRRFKSPTRPIVHDNSARDQSRRKVHDRVSRSPGAGEYKSNLEAEVDLLELARAWRIG
ncbi:hypothetical protein B0J11DRAFT_541808 [Dendryphion nanum]|uniref:F-box domain-containing protein n=1 Tax=Dendryphion nanum TaxID=256645 RepID=A0A9P9IAW2_9PLEO|nr:hypothetical protein B0J11DRAFT_541808 [Dendryphion nanum]